MQLNNKTNRTYSSFPQINKELSGNKIIPNNYNYFKTKEIKLNENALIKKFVNQGPKVAAYVNKPKKVLLTNQNNIPPNTIIRRNRGNNTIKKNLFGNQSEKGKRVKKYENMYNSNNQFYIPSYLKVKDEEKYKSWRNINVNKSPLK